MQVAKWYNGTQMKIAQTVWTGLQYSFLSEKGEQLSPFVHCKEFMMDTVWAELNNKPISTYGFLYHPEFFPKVCLTETRLLLRNWEDKEFVQGVQNCMRFLNQLERKLNFNPSKAVEVTNPRGMMYVERVPVMFVSGDPKWMLSPPLLSLYTMLLRVGMTYTKGSAWVFMKKLMKGKERSYGREDAWRLTKIYDTVKILVDTKAEIFGTDMKKNWPTTRETGDGKVVAYDIHENAGIMCFANGKAKYICPDWYPPEPEPEPETQEVLLEQ